MSSLPYVDVTVTPDTERHWRDLAAGLLTVSWCDACDTHVWYPKPICPRCLNSTGWKTLSGEGAVYTFSIVHRGLPGFEGPYVFAYVTVDGGPTIMGNIVGANALAVKIGDRVALTSPDHVREFGAARFMLI